MHTRPEPRRHRPALLWGCFALLLAAPGCGSPEPSVREFTVIGPSMHPTLKGPSWRTVCRQCRLDFTVVALGQPPERVTCSNCGASAPFQSTRLATGIAGKVDLAAFRTAGPARDDVVALEAGSGMLQVKRVVALPGDSVRIAGGDLWIDGRRYQKDIRQLRQRAILVHDDRFRPADGSRWRAANRWVTTSQGHRWSGNSASGDAAPDLGDWLVYHHHSPHAAGSSKHPSPVLDDYPSNQTIRRRLWPVGDLGVSLRVDAPAGARCELAIWNGQEPVRAQLDVGRGLAGRRLWFAWLDGRLVANVPLAAANVEDSTFVPITAGRPLGIRPLGQESLAVSELRVIRDLHLLGPPGEELDWTAPRLAAERYFVLGDNVPASRDSRQAPAGVPRTAILGRVVIAAQNRSSGH